METELMTGEEADEKVSQRSEFIVEILCIFCLFHAA